jgi:hypothetical protein
MKRPRLLKSDTQEHDYGTNTAFLQPRMGLNINNPGWKPGGRNTPRLTEPRRGSMYR